MERTQETIRKNWFFGVVKDTRGVNVEKEVVEMMENSVDMYKTFKKHKI